VRLRGDSEAREKQERARKSGALRATQRWYSIRHPDPVCEAARKPNPTPPETPASLLKARILWKLLGFQSRPQYPVRYAPWIDWYATGTPMSANTTIGRATTASHADFRPRHPSVSRVCR
jgi:hypothetical protein